MISLPLNEYTVTCTNSYTWLVDCDRCGSAVIEEEQPRPLAEVMDEIQKHEYGHHRRLTIDGRDLPPELQPGSPLYQSVLKLLKTVDKTDRAMQRMAPIVWEEIAHAD